MTGDGLVDGMAVAKKLVNSLNCLVLQLVERGIKGEAWMTEEDGVERTVSGTLVMCGI